MNFSRDCGNYEHYITFYVLLNSFCPSQSAGSIDFCRRFLSAGSIDPGSIDFCRRKIATKIDFVAFYDTQSATKVAATFFCDLTFLCDFFLRFMQTDFLRQKSLPSKCSLLQFLQKDFYFHNYLYYQPYLQLVDVVKGNKFYQFFPIFI